MYVNEIMHGSDLALWHRLGNGYNGDACFPHLLAIEGNYEGQV